MRKVLFILGAGAIGLLFSCSGNDNKIVTEEGSALEKVDKGASLGFAERERYLFLDPITVTDVTSFHVSSQIFEGLLRFNDKNLSLESSLAKFWKVDDKKQVYTFSLRKGVYFHENECFDNAKGREFKSSDVLYTFKRIFSKATDNYAYTQFKGTILGGDKFYNSDASFDEKELKGVVLIDDYTVQITLEKPLSNFLELVASFHASIVAREAIFVGAVSGTGPFVYNKEKDTEEKIVLTKNTNYYLKDKENNSLPYLDEVIYSYVNSAKTQLELFLNGELDVVTKLPPKAVKEIVNNQIADFQDKPVRYVLGRYPLMATTFLNFNTAKSPFNALKVRQAFAQAINKEKIITEVLKGEAFGPGIHGVVPPAVQNYDYASVIGLEYNVKKAKRLLGEAGYEDGEGFPSVTLISAKDNNSIRTALNIQKQLFANLGISIEIQSLTLAEIVEMDKFGKGDLSIGGWLAEFPDPLSFLNVFYSADVPAKKENPTYINKTRYVNAKFDALVDKATASIDEEQKYEYCLEADQIIANEVPSVPLWYQENYRLIQGFVKGYHPNTMNIQYLVNVKLDKQ